MGQVRPFSPSTSGDDDRITRSLAGLAAALLLVVLSLVVIRKLQVRCMLEVCAMSQQPGCETLADHLRVSRTFERLWGAS